MTFLMVLGVAAVVIALGVVAMLTMRNRSPTESVAQLLYDTEHPKTASSPRPRAPRP